MPLASPAVARPTARPVVVQRQSGPAPEPPAPPPAPPVPIQPTAAAAPPRPAPRTTTVARTATASPPARQPTTETAPAPESPTQLDELARRLVTPLSRLLRAELRADRERVGRLRDHGH
ncbi:hypothetical protein [Streptomyces sp. NPDC056194]|uniref:hypothetical protein n=1 Tax=unclassified Streptomyces TaxID=2593676 RepID=UPI0035DE351A